MNWLNRLAHKKQLQGDVQRDVFAAVELNALNLEDVAAVKAMVETEGWQMYMHELKKDLTNKQKTLEELSVDPENNKFKLAYYGAACALIRRQLAFVDGVLKKETPLLREQNRLREVLRPQTNN